MCIFCDIANGKTESSIVYEDDKAMAFLDIDPINEGHVLLIPKEHYLDMDEMPQELVLHLAELTRRFVGAVKKAYHPDGYSVMQNGGKFNDIGHFHIHVFPRYENDGFGWTSSEESKDAGKETAEKIRKYLDRNDRDS